MPGYVQFSKIKLVCQYFLRLPQHQVSSENVQNLKKKIVGWFKLNHFVKNVLNKSSLSS